MSCHQCNKKSLTVIICKCGNHYCLKHRYAESHECTFDYKESAKEMLNKKLYKIEADKMANRI